MLYASSNPQGHAMNTNLITGCLVSAMRLVFPSKKAPQQHSVGETHHRQALLICGPFVFRD
jgi:hypothetical protein